MKWQNIIRCSLVAAGTVAALVGGAGAWAETPAAPNSPAADGTGGPPRLLSAEERERFRNEMANAKSAEERQKVREQHRSFIEQRAKEKGITLPPQGMGPRGPGGGGVGRGDGPRAQLLTPQERTQFHEQMHSAQTPEERQKLREQHRAVMEQRAKEQGITLPDGRGPRGGQGGGPGMGGAAGPEAPGSPRR